MGVTACWPWARFLGVLENVLLQPRPRPKSMLCLYGFGFGFAASRSIMRRTASICGADWR
jgi:hypothetical protein